MSDQAKSEVTTQGEGQTAIPAVIIPLDERLAQLEKTNQRLLSESKEWKSKAQVYKDQKDQEEMLKLEKEKNHEKILIMEREKFESERSKFTQFKKNAYSKFLESEILKHAPDALDIHLIKQSLPVDLITVIEDDNEIKFEGLKEGVEQVKKNKTFLFRSPNAPQMATGKPAANNASTQKQTTQLSQMKTSGEILDYWKANPHIK